MVRCIDRFAHSRDTPDGDGDGDGAPAAWTAEGVLEAHTAMKSAEGARAKARKAAVEALLARDDAPAEAGAAPAPARRKLAKARAAALTPAKKGARAAVDNENANANAVHA